MKTVNSLNISDDLLSSIIDEDKQTIERLEESIARLETMLEEKEELNAKLLAEVRSHYPDLWPFLIT